MINSNEEAREGVREKKIIRGDVFIVGYEGPHGGPGMREIKIPVLVRLLRGQFFHD